MISYLLCIYNFHTIWKADIWLASVWVHSFCSWNLLCVHRTYFLSCEFSDPTTEDSDKGTGSKLGTVSSLSVSFHYTKYRRYFRCAFPPVFSCIWNIINFSVLILQYSEWIMRQKTWYKRLGKNKRVLLYLYCLQSRVPPAYIFPKISLYKLELENSYIF